MSKILSLGEKDSLNTSQGWKSKDPSFGMESPLRVRKNLYLFMIGGTGASVIEPLLYYFEGCVKSAGYTIVPIFIDREFNSEIVSRSILSIKNYQTYCAYTASSLFVANPYLFVDDNSLLSNDSNLGLIINKICSNDTVAFAFSVSSTNKHSRRVRQLIMEAISLSEVRIFNLVFLPYFILQFGGREFLDSEKYNEEREFLISKDFTAFNLKSLHPQFGNEHFFYAGLPTPSLYTKSDYQKNPFNVVSLIQSYALSSFLSKEMEGNNTYEFGISIKPIYNLNDLIPNSSLRETVISFDFKSLCWSHVSQSDALTHYGISHEVMDQITMFYESASSLIKQLQDKTVHRDLQIVIRRSFNFSSVWKEFVRNDYGIVKRKHSKSSWVKDLLSYIQTDAMVTPNMVIHETLKSIDTYIKEHWIEIENLYY